MTWETWLSMPPEHRALYLSVSDTKRRMDAVDERKRKEQQEADERRRGAR